MKKKIISAIIYILSLAVISAGISIFITDVAKDAFALGKASSTAKVEIPDGADTDDVAEIFFGAGLIKFPSIFKIYSFLRGENGEYLPGEYEIDGALSYDELRGAVKARRKERKQIKLTFPEGCDVDGIIEIFTSAGIGEREKFIEVINNFDFGFDFLDNISSDGRVYRLEGYLFPDTYWFYSDSSETEAIYKMLSCFDARVSDDIREKAEKNSLTLDQLITLASIIEKEAYYKSDMAYISSVFLNRLRSKSMKKLESDATAVYARDVGKADSHGVPTKDDLLIDSPYNTYKYEGLPPGAICSPGLEAIEAAAEPEKTNYYYFVCKKDKSAVFSRTYAEHMRAVEAAGK